MSKTARKEAYTSLQAGIGDRIVWARELASLKQSELARLIGVVAPTLNKIEKGDRAPSVFNVIELANRLRVSTDYILRGLLDARTDQEMALKLAASHPELVLRNARTGQSTDTDPADDKSQKPKTRVRVG